ncbi:MAG: hypothetical protein JWR59_2243 [Brevundimonas sp.]|nr:hypothetical protein [Brevundimonas sp.]
MHSALAAHVCCWLVLAQSLEAGLPKPTATGPLGDFGLRDQLGLNEVQAVTACSPGLLARERGLRPGKPLSRGQSSVTSRSRKPFLRDPA